MYKFQVDAFGISPMDAPFEERKKNFAQIIDPYRRHSARIDRLLNIFNGNGGAIN